MVKVIIAFTISASILSSTAKETSTNMRAGLWEITTTSDLLLLAQHIPKDQLKGIEQIAKEYGLEIPQLEGGAAISQSCITQKMAKQQILPNLYQEELGCASNNAIRNGNHYKVSFSCNSKELKGQGTAEGTITSSESFSGNTQFIGQAQGAPINEKADINGKWVSANCGKTQPL